MMLKKGGKKLHGIKLMKWTSKYIRKGWTIILEIFIYPKVCTDKYCQVHLDDINKFHDDIINVLLTASLESIPRAKPACSNVVHGWNVYVEEYFRSSLFWHSSWLENGHPKEGIIADWRRKTITQYHRVCKMVMRHESEIRGDYMAEALMQSKSKSFWAEAKKCRPRKSNLPKTVDGIQGEENIAGVFAKKCETLYNSVPYDRDDMDRLLNVMNISFSNICECNKCKHVTHSIYVNDVSNTVNKLRQGKGDGSTEVLSDDIINASGKLKVFLSLLFTPILCHGISPEGMQNRTMIPIPKGRWSNLITSDTFRAITLSSIFSKLIDIIVMNKENQNLCTSGGVMCLVCY